MQNRIRIVGPPSNELVTVGADIRAPSPLVEILDFGYPQNSETDTLKMYITTEGVKSEQAVVGLVSRSFWTAFSADIAPEHTAARGLFKDHNPGHWRYLVAPRRREIQEKRSIRRRRRERQPAHVEQRCARCSMLRVEYPLIVPRCGHTHTGTILRADVDGQILMRAYLSGTPECKFGLNDKLVLDRR